MAKPYVHAETSVKDFGGKVEDYLPIHELMDSSKSAFPDNRHRAITHNTWFVCTIIEKIFGVAIKNSDGKMIPTREIAERHVLEDFGGRFVPTVQDYLQGMRHEPWMSNIGSDHPASNYGFSHPDNLPSRPDIYPHFNQIVSPNFPKNNGVPNQYPID